MFHVWFGVAVGILRAHWDKYICWFLGIILLIYEKKQTWV
jgi:hypothetical protein